MEIRLTTVVSSLMVLIFLPLYLFYIPDDIAAGDDKNSINVNKQPNNLYWGMVDADFDWCELNYQHSSYIAEFFNTTSAFVYILFALLEYKEYSKYNDLMPGIVLFIKLHFLLGIGTLLFHTTLRYKAQLCDELSMFYISCQSYVLYQFTGIILIPTDKTTGIFNKNSKEYKNYQLAHKIDIIFCILLTIVLFATSNKELHNDNDSTSIIELIHGIARAVFGIGFAVTNVLAYKYGYDVATKAVAFKYYAKSFGFLVTGFIFWLIENTFCSYLQQMPFYNSLYLPYLQIHAIIWHVLSCLAIHYSITLNVTHRFVTCMGYQHGQDVQMSVKYGYLFEYLEVKKHFPNEKTE